MEKLYNRINDEFLELQKTVQALQPEILEDAIFSAPECTESSNCIIMKAYTNPDVKKTAYRLEVIVRHMDYEIIIYREIILYREAANHEMKILFEKTYAMGIVGNEDRKQVYQNFLTDLHQHIMQELLEYAKRWTRSGYGKQLLSLDPYRYMRSAKRYIESGDGGRIMERRVELQTRLASLTSRYMHSGQSAKEAYANDLEHKFDITECKSARIPEILDLVQKKAKKYHYEYEDLLLAFRTDLAVEFYKLPWNIRDRSLDVKIPLMIYLDTGNWPYLKNDQLRYVSGDELERFSILWVAKALGKEDVFRKALPRWRESMEKHSLFNSGDPFVNELFLEDAHLPEDGRGTFTFFVTLAFGQALDLVDTRRRYLLEVEKAEKEHAKIPKNCFNAFLTIPSGCACGLYDPVTYGNTAFGIAMCQDIKIPVENIRYNVAHVDQLLKQKLHMASDNAEQGKMYPFLVATFEDESQTQS